MSVKYVDISENTKIFRQYISLSEMMEELVDMGCNPLNEPARSIYRKCNTLWRKLSDEEKSLLLIEDNVYYW